MISKSIMVKILAVTIAFLCIISTPVFAESVHATGEYNVQSSGVFAGLINFNIKSFVYYDNNYSTSVYMKRAFTRVTNNTTNSVLTDIRYECYNGTYDYHNVYFYSLGTLEGGENSYGFKYYDTVINKTGNTPCVFLQITGATNWDAGGGHTIYFPSLGSPYSIP